MVSPHPKFTVSLHICRYICMVPDLLGQGSAIERWLAVRCFTIFHPEDSNQMPPPTHLYCTQTLRALWAMHFCVCFLNGSLPRTTHNLKAFTGFRLREPPLFSNTFHSPEVIKNLNLWKLKVYNCLQLQFFGSTKRDFQQCFGSFGSLPCRPTLEPEPALHLSTTERSCRMPCSSGKLRVPWHQRWWESASIDVKVLGGLRWRIFELVAGAGRWMEASKR